jgi:hypothetical protein
MTSSRTRGIAAGVIGLRIAYGAGLILAPSRLAKRWLGTEASAAPTQVPLRGLGMREIVLHAGALVAALSDAPLRPWLLGSIAGDLTDIVATFTGRRQLPEGSAIATLVVGGGSALASGALAMAVER